MICQLQLILLSYILVDYDFMSIFDKDLLGVMVWYCSVQNGLKYAATWDTTGREDSMAGFVEAMDLLNNAK